MTTFHRETAGFLSESHAGKYTGVRRVAGRDAPTSTGSTPTKAVQR